MSSDLMPGLRDASDITVRFLKGLEVSDNWFARRFRVFLVLRDIDSALIHFDESNCGARHEDLQVGNSCSNSALSD